MCGITGFWEFTSRIQAAEMRAVAQAMAASIEHRGPDGRGAWIDEMAGMALAHLRLAIIDLSPLGAQPMTSSNGRFVIVFNGELYNYKEMRRELEGASIVFRGQSDTEVLLEACAHWGIRRAIEKCNGMFALAIYDRAARKLTLARDHIGIKPLYWAMMGGNFLFGSELKALRAHPSFVARLDRAAAASFFRFAYVPSPMTIYEGVHKLPPGHIMTVENDGSCAIVPYWSLAEVAANALTCRRRMADQEAVDGLERVLRDAVRRQMVADVPVGVLLSGGIDSSTVAALAQAQNTRRVRSFAIGFHVQGFDEATHAAAVARHLGTEHTELYVDAAMALDVIPRLPHMYDEPFADPSQIPTHLVSALTRRHVSVVLSGDGGDELFGGYERYFHALRLTRIPMAMPPALRRLLARALTQVPAQALDAAVGHLPRWLRLQRLGTKLRKASAMMTEKGHDRLYRRLMSHWTEEDNPVLNAQEHRNVFWDDELAKRVPHFTERMQFIDSITYLPDDILVKVDRASMSVALEARVPLLDPRVAAYAWTLAPHQRVRRGIGKWVLRQVLYRHVPAALVDRPKMGFGAPVGEWMRGPLREWCEDLLSERSLRTGGILRPDVIRQRWREHLSGRVNWQYTLWDVLMFESWRRVWLAPSTG
jgi:asparagine synthase (glutamine-hydrolysing)